MKKPKIKKRGGAWLVYTDKKRAFTCYDYSGVKLYYNVLLLELKK